MVEVVFAPGGVQDYTLAVNIRKCIFAFKIYVCVSIYLLVHWYNSTCYILYYTCYICVCMCVKQQSCRIFILIPGHFLNYSCIL